MATPQYDIGAVRSAYEALPDDFRRTLPKPGFSQVPSVFARDSHRHATSWAEEVGPLLEDHYAKVEVEAEKLAKSLADGAERDFRSTGPNVNSPRYMASAKAAIERQDREEAAAQARAAADRAKVARADAIIKALARGDVSSIVTTIAKEEAPAATPAPATPPAPPAAASPMPSAPSAPRALPQATHGPCAGWTGEQLRDYFAIFASKSPEERAARRARSGQALEKFLEIRMATKHVSMPRWTVESMAKALALHGEIKATGKGGRLTKSHVSAPARALGPNEFYMASNLAAGNRAFYGAGGELSRNLRGRQ